jgi:carbon-monoxide dehydrogenase medium subunit
MKAADFRYERPNTVAAALALLADESVESAALAGGQSLMPMMNFRIAQPEMLVDLNGIADLAGVTVANDRLTIGAMTRYATLEQAPELTHAPLIAQALPHIAHSAIRNRGTIGGSLALADPAAEMPAVMLALGAEMMVQSADVTRVIPVDDFFLGVYETARRATELLTSVSIPTAQPGDRFGFYEIARRHGDYAMAGVAVAQRQGQFRIAFFSVADRAIRATGAEDVLSADPTNIDAAVARLSEIDFDSDLNASVATKQHYAGVVLRRALAGMTA